MVQDIYSKIFSQMHMHTYTHKETHTHTHTHTHWMCLWRNKGEVRLCSSLAIIHFNKKKKGRFLFISFHLSDYHLKGSIGVPKYLRLINFEFHVLTADPIILFPYLKLWDECLSFFWKKSKLLIII